MSFFLISFALHTHVSLESPSQCSLPEPLFSLSKLLVLPPIAQDR
jgi:hypothetical protein